MAWISGPATRETPGRRMSVTSMIHAVTNGLRGTPLDPDSPSLANP